MRAYPGYSCAKHIKTEGRVILVDVPFNAETSAELLNLRSIDGRELLLLDVQEAADLLEVFLGKVSEHEDALFVFPGNGSNYPKSRSLICREVHGVGVYAKRIWTPGTDPIAIAGTIAPEVFMDLRTRLIIVVDDVISSGQTMYKLYRNNEWRFPRAEWIGVTWFSQALCMKSSSGVKGYNSVFASFLVEGVSGKKVPINSLSTLREQPAIAESYANRHYADVKKFLQLIG